jgi:nicotinamidase-related amidase
MPSKAITLLSDQEWPSTAFEFDLPISPEKSAMGVIDMQRYCIHPDEHLGKTILNHTEEIFVDYARSVEGAIKKTQSLLSCFREAGRRVFFTQHGMQLPDGSDLIARRRRREAVAHQSGSQSGHMTVKGSRGYEIIPELAPQAGEMIFDKNTSSAFHSSPIDLFLRNQQVETLVLAGIASDQCVFTTALDAADRGFHVIIATDACANLDPGSALAVQVLFGRVWGYVMSTEDIIQWLKTGEKPSRTRLAL